MEIERNRDEGIEEEGKSRRGNGGLGVKGKWEG